VSYSFDKKVTVISVTHLFIENGGSNNGRVLIRFEVREFQGHSMTCSFKVTSFLFDRLSRGQVMDFSMENGLAGRGDLILVWEMKWFLPIVN